jgi:hypothetical protein
MKTVVYVCTCRRKRRRIVAMMASRSADSRGQMVKFLNEFRARLTQVRVDAIGLGYNFGLHLRDCGFPVELINVGLPCESIPALGDTDPALRFLNRKAWFYQNLADAFERDQIEGFIDDVTFGQLAGIRHELDSRGRLRIESKEKARQRGVGSPDRADALMLALGMPMELVPLPLFVRAASVPRRYQGGETVEEIAEDLEVSPDQVHSWLWEAARRGLIRLCDRCGEGFGLNDQITRQGYSYSHVTCPPARRKPE